MKRNESFYLRHILDAIAKAEAYLQDLDEAAFSACRLMLDLFRKELPEIPALFLK